MKTTVPITQKNHLLANLPEAVCERLQPSLQNVDLSVGMIIYEADAKQHRMCFPRSGIVSLLYTMQNGDTGEIAMVGNEGVVGTGVIVDGGSTPHRAIVTTAGQGLMLSSAAVDREFKQNGDFQLEVLRYTQVLVAQMVQTAICSRHHTIERQLCRWLLLSFDRIESETLKMTQEEIARMLGVRREGITEAAGRLQEDGLIRYSRGNIRILDRRALEQRSCECYRVVRKEYDRLLTARYPK